jgi:hypothetical protein
MKKQDGDLKLNDGAASDWRATATSVGTHCAAALVGAAALYKPIEWLSLWLKAGKAAKDLKAAEAAKAGCFLNSCKIIPQFVLDHKVMAALIAAGVVVVGAGVAAYEAGYLTSDDDEDEEAQLA